MNKVSPKRLHVDCACDHPLHTVRFTLDPDEAELTMDVRLTPCVPWYKRVWFVVCYVWSGKSTHSPYADVIFKHKDICELKELFGDAMKVQKRATDAWAKQIVEQEKMQLTEKK